MIYLWLMLLALILLIAFAPLVFLIRIVTIKSGLEDYFHTVAVGIDQLGGSILYNEEDHTISAYTAYLARKNIKAAIYFEKFINFFFGNGHCMDSYLWEVSMMLFKQDEVKETKKSSFADNLGVIR